MLDINYIRENVDQIKETIRLKKIGLDLDELIEVDDQRKKFKFKIDELRNKRNELANAASGQKPSDEMIEQGKLLKQQIADLEQDYKVIEDKYLDLMVKVPNIQSADTPIGADESGNVEVMRSGDIPQFDFPIKDHIQLAQDLDLIDFERGVKVAGYRGYYLKNEAVLIHLGLMMYALETLISKGFTPIIPPTLIREFALFGSGYFATREYNPDIDEIYKIANDEKLADGTVKKENRFLVGTAEPSLLAYYAGEVLDEANLPLKLCGFSQCYRSEIGSYGKDTKGVYRIHEFMKVEQVCISPADKETSEKLHKEMLDISKELHEGLGLPYRQLAICTGDLSAGKYKMFDLEAWMPSREAYGETGSASNFLDWQSRRLNVKYKTKDGDKKFVYMLNNTALASPRIIISILECNQQADGSVVVPEVLRKYVGKDVIKRGFAQS